MELLGIRVLTYLRTEKKLKPHLSFDIYPNLALRSDFVIGTKKFDEISQVKKYLTFAISSKCNQFYFPQQLKCRINWIELS